MRRNSSTSRKARKGVQVMVVLSALYIALVNAGTATPPLIARMN
jgi:hypothetical protein